MMTASSRGANRLVCVVMGIGALVAAPAADASGSLGALLACRSIEASAGRLACFDRESAALAAQREQSQKAVRQALSPRRTFGLAPAEIAARADAAAHVPKPLEAITAHIASLSKAADGREIFTLDNHEVWVQLIPDGELPGARPGAAVRISRGWLGSYRLSLPSRLGCKVTRLR